MAKWTFFTLMVEAAKYESRSAFKTSSQYAYQQCKKQDLLDSFFPPLKEWTHDELLTESKKYKTRMDFKDGSRGAYEVAKADDLLDTFYPDTPPLLSPFEAYMIVIARFDHFWNMADKAHGHHELQWWHFELRTLPLKFIGRRPEYLEAAARINRDVHDRWQTINRDERGNLKYLTEELFVPHWPDAVEKGLLAAVAAEKAAEKKIADERRLLIDSLGYVEAMKKLSTK